MVCCLTEKSLYLNQCWLIISEVQWQSPEGSRIRHQLLNSDWKVILTHWGRDKMDAISQTTFSSAFLFNENVWITIKNSLKIVPKGPINNIPALVQIMAWRRPGDKPLSEPMLVSVPTHICVTRPEWVKYHSHHLKAIALNANRVRDTTSCTDPFGNKLWALVILGMLLNVNEMQMTFST